MSMQAWGQTSNTSGGAVANQPTGAVNLPILAAAAETTVVVNNTNITANSIILAIAYNQTADATAAVSVIVDVRSVAAGTATFHASNRGTAAMVAAWTIWYVVLN